ncbi:DNA recombination protein RmuC [Streptococcus merionis]|uniref:Putative DNA recombination protein RmuC n=1 Tax=Streptococcus merionis TaxID=400065 RepID=A0A239T061_9STRE|nr:DNA recombination protein RmuC [Streptococcus merionis]SNU90872.1 putative DNA recombination protein RmuC [Streptococcus merionis]
MEILLLILSIVLLVAVFFLWQGQKQLQTDFEEMLDSQADRMADQMTYLLERSGQNQLRDLHQATSQTSDRLTDVRKDLYHHLTELRQEITQNLDQNRTVLSQGLQQMQSSNEGKLEAMRQTVEEKLEKTLQTRLRSSFETVSKQLESVNKGLGEMKTVARDVGSLSKVLSGTKSRGILGEIQLAQIIEDIMSPSQYEREIPTIAGSSDRVEFAIKLPGQSEGETVYLPIDAKFPLDAYYRLEEAHDEGDKAQVESARKALLASVKGFAKDINRKYISPPETTQFGILFLPTEGLYAEIVRQPAFFDDLRRTENIVIAGPSTLSALLNSLSVGFRTLNIQRSADDISKVLGNVKTEFGKFGNLLQKTQVQLGRATKNIDSLLTTRTQAIERALRTIEHYGEDGKLPEMLQFDAVTEDEKTFPDQEDFG